MHRLFLIGAAVSAMAVSFPSGASAQAVTPLDGKYTGVSLTAGGVGHDCAPRAPVPAPLIISGGAATTTQGEVTYTGAVMGDGRMTLRSAAAYIMNGKVDSSGAASATVTTSHGCTFSFVWKKQ